jgi:hypothetical protein
MRAKGGAPGSPGLISQGQGAPYMRQPLGVASPVPIESGHLPIHVTEDLVIAALLHDAAEAD